MRPTLTNIARLAEVNPSTVSRIINGRDGFFVSSATRERVLKIAKQLNYEPKRAARSLASGKSYTAAVVLGRFERDLASYAFTQILGELTREMAKHNYTLTILPIDPEQGIDGEVLRTVRGSHADGFFVPYSLLRSRTLAELKQAKTPVVSIYRNDSLNEENDDYQYVSYAELDDREAAREVVAELVRLGHRKVVYFGVAGQHESRAASYFAAAAEYPPDVIEIQQCIYERRRRGAAYICMEAHRVAHERFDEIAACTAVLCSTDRMALGVVETLVEHGITPGREISVIGRDNLEENPSGKLPSPELCTVDHCNDGLGRAVAELLMERIDDPTALPRNITLPARFIRRASLGPAPATAAK